MAKIKISEKKLLAKHPFIWFSILVLFMFCGINSSFAANLEQKKITLPQKTEGIEKIEYTVDGSPRGSTSGKSVVGIDYGSSINFLVKIKPELHTKLTVGAVKVASGSNDMLKLGIYKLDKDNKLTIEYPKDDELIDPNQTYVSQPYTVHSDESFSVNGVVPDTFVTSIKLENNDCAINEALEVTYQVLGNKVENAEYSPENNSYLIKNIPSDKRVKIGIKTQEAYSQSKFTVIKDGQEMEYSQKENSVTLPAKARDNELTIKNISKNKYSVLFESQEGITFKYKYENENSDFKDINSGSLNAVYGDSFLFTYLTDQENFMDNKEITSNGVALRSYEKVYSLKNIKEDIKIAAKNKEDSSYNISLLPENAGAYVIDESENKVSSAIVKYGESYKFKIKAKEGYTKEIDNALIYAIPTEKLTNGDYDTDKNSEEAKKYLVSPSLDGTFSIDSVKEPVSLLVKNLNLNTYVLEFPKTLENGTYSVEENESVKKLNETAYQVIHGTSVKVTVTPVEGKSTAKMTFECSGQQAKINKNGNVYTIENVTQDSSVEMSGIKDTEYTIKFDNPGAICTNEYGIMYGSNREMTLTKSGTAKFKIQIVNDEYILEPEGIKASLKSGKATLNPPQDGEEYYTLSNVQEDIEIAITGIKHRPVNVQLNSDSKAVTIKSATEDTELPSTNKIDYGSDFNFKVESRNMEGLSVVDESGEKIEPIQMQENANLYSLKSVSQNTAISVQSSEDLPSGNNDYAKEFDDNITNIIKKADEEERGYYLGLLKQYVRHIFFNMDESNNATSSKGETPAFVVYPFHDLEIDQKVSNTTENNTSDTKIDIDGLSCEYKNIVEKEGESYNSYDDTSVVTYEEIPKNEVISKDIFTNNETNKNKLEYTNKNYFVHRRYKGYTNCYEGTATISFGIKASYDDIKKIQSCDVQYNSNINCLDNLDNKIEWSYVFNGQASNTGGYIYSGLASKVNSQKSTSKDMRECVYKISITIHYKYKGYRYPQDFIDSDLFFICLARKLKITLNIDDKDDHIDDGKQLLEINPCNEIAFKIPDRSDEEHYFEHQDYEFSYKNVIQKEGNTSETAEKPDAKEETIVLDKKNAKEDTIAPDKIKKLSMSNEEYFRHYTSAKDSKDKLIRYFEGCTTITANIKASNKDKDLFNRIVSDKYKSLKLCYLDKEKKETELEDGKEIEFDLAKSEKNLKNETLSEDFNHYSMSITPTISVTKDTESGTLNVTIKINYIYSGTDATVDGSIYSFVFFDNLYIKPYVLSKYEPASSFTSDKLTCMVNPLKKLIFRCPDDAKHQKEEDGVIKEEEELILNELMFRYNNRIKKIGANRTASSEALTSPETVDVENDKEINPYLDKYLKSFSSAPENTLPASKRYFTHKINPTMDNRSVTDYFEGTLKMSIDMDLSEIKESNILGRISKDKLKITYNKGNEAEEELSAGSSFNICLADKYTPSADPESSTFCASKDVLGNFKINSVDIVPNNRDYRYGFDITISYTYSDKTGEDYRNSVLAFKFFENMYVEPVLNPITDIDVNFETPKYIEGNDSINLDGVTWSYNYKLGGKEYKLPSIENGKNKNGENNTLKLGKDNNIYIYTSYPKTTYSLKKYGNNDVNKQLISKKEDGNSSEKTNIILETIDYNEDDNCYRFCYSITNNSKTEGNSVTIYPTLGSSEDYERYSIIQVNNGGVKYTNDSNNSKLYGKNFTFDAAPMDAVKYKYKYENYLDKITISCADCSITIDNTNNNIFENLKSDDNEIPLSSLSESLESKLKARIDEIDNEIKNKKDEKEKETDEQKKEKLEEELKNLEKKLKELKFQQKNLNSSIETFNLHLKKKDDKTITFKFENLKLKNIKFEASSPMQKCKVMFEKCEGVSYKLANSENDIDLTTEGTSSNIYSNVSFRVNVNEGYDSKGMSVTYRSANSISGKEIKPDSSGIYKFKLEEDTTVTVTNVVALTYTVTPTNYDYVKFVLCEKSNNSLNEKEYFDNKKDFKYGDTIYFKTKISDHYTGSGLKVYAQDSSGNVDEINTYKSDENDENKDKIYEYKVTKSAVLIVSGIIPDTYTVSFKQDDNSEGKIKFIDQYTLEEIGNKTVDVSYGNDYGFRIKAEDGTDISNLQIYDTVTEKGDSTNSKTSVLQPVNGIYTLKSVSENHTISYANTQKNKCKINFRTTQGVSCLDESGNDIGTQTEAEYGIDYTFIVSVADAYNHSKPTVKLKKDGALDEDLTSVDGKKYTIKGIITDCTVVISDVTKNSYKATFEPTEGVIYKTAKNKPFTEPQEVEYDGNLYFKISLMDAYDQSYPWVLLNGEKTLVENGGVYNLENIRSDVVITVKNVTKNPEEITIDDVNNVPDEVATENDINDVVKATLTYDSLTDEEKTKVTNTAKLKEAQQKVGELNHSENGVSISGVDWNIKLVVISLTEDEGKMKEFDQKVDRRSLLSLYEMHLVDILTNEEYEVPYGKKVSVNLPAPDLTGYSNTVVAHEKKSGSMEYLDANIVDNTAQFQTSSFSLFGIASKKIPNYSENPSDTQIAVADLVDDKQELQSLLGEGLVSKLGNIMDDSEENNSDSSDSSDSSNSSNSSDKSNKNSGNNSTSEEDSTTDTDENSDSSYSSGDKKSIIKSIDLEKAYNWALDNEFISVIIILIIGSLLIWLLICLSRRKKDPEDEEKSNKVKK